jgi:hypothetical protein
VTLPPAAVSIYETLRNDVLAGRPRPDGFGAIVYHGLIHGLLLLSQSLPEPETAPIAIPQALPNVRIDRQFLRVVANMVLQAHQEMTHVY